MMQTQKRVFKAQFDKVQPFTKSLAACHICKPVLLFGLSFLMANRTGMWTPTRRWMVLVYPISGVAVVKQMTKEMTKGSLGPRLEHVGTLNDMHEMCCCPWLQRHTPTSPKMVLATPGVRWIEVGESVLFDQPSHVLGCFFNVGLNANGKRRSLVRSTYQWVQKESKDLEHV